MNIKTAKVYRDRYGFSVIPLGGNKKPYSSLLPIDKKTGKPKWKPYQTRKATDEELKKWFGTKHEGIMIGIVTGKISNLAVIDFDDKSLVSNELIDESATPIASTPRGYHFYFEYVEGVTNTAHVGGQLMDVRGEGGYVVAPPSVTPEGKAYTWVKSLTTPRVKFPLEFFSQTGEVLDTQEPMAKANYEVQKMVQFEEGARDESFFRIASNLVRGGMREEEVRAVIKQLHSTLPKGTHPFSLKDALAKVDQAIRKPGKPERNWSGEAREYVEFTSGWFSRVAVYNDLGAKLNSDKACIRMALHRFVEQGILEKNKERDGSYRLIQQDLEIIDWQSAPVEETPMRFPLGIEEYVKIYPKSLIMIAGEKDAGKTGFLLEFARLNMNDHEIHFFMNETGDTELAVRLRMFKGMKTRDWDRVKFFRRDDNFEDVIQPNAINLIDYLDVTEGFANIGTPLKAIHGKLETGVAIVAIQKNPARYDFKKSEYIDVDLGIGGAKSIGKSRLYIAISEEGKEGLSKVKIVRAKCRRGKDSPNGLMRDFKIYDGHDFVSFGDWRKK